MAVRLTEGSSLNLPGEKAAAVEATETPDQESYCSMTRQEEPEASLLAAALLCSACSQKQTKGAGCFGAVFVGQSLLFETSPQQGPLSCLRWIKGNFESSLGEIKCSTCLGTAYSQDWEGACLITDNTKPDREPPAAHTLLASMMARPHGVKRCWQTAHT